MNALLAWIASIVSSFLARGCATVRRRSQAQRAALGRFPRRNASTGFKALARLAMHGVLTAVFVGVFTCAAHAVHEQLAGDHAPLQERGEQSDAQLDKSIPLSSVFGSFAQDGMQNAARKNKTLARSINTIFGESSGVGASNVFLVSGDSIEDAVAATLRVFAASTSADDVVKSDDASSSHFWAVAYLGISGSGSPWIVHDIKLDGTAVRIRASKPKIQMGAADVHQYFLWVPLGQLEPATYDIELRDAETERLTLLRQVVVRRNADE